MVIKSSHTDSQAASPSLPPNYDWKVLEARVRRFNEELDLPETVHEALGKNPLVGYVEGPADAQRRPAHRAHPRAG